MITLKHSLKITSTLADETRYSIYEMILQTKKAYTVQQIADLFYIHPNVARLHLTKLSEIGVIIANYEKTGKGGRPGRVYQAANKAIMLSFPKREYNQLLLWTLTLIKRMGVEALDIGREISYQDGFNEISRTAQSMNNSSIEEKIALLTESAHLIGYVPKFEQNLDKLSVQFTIFNCPYYDYLKEYQQIVCTLHEAYLRGQMDALFGESNFVQFEKMASGCDFCRYSIQSPIMS